VESDCLFANFLQLSAFNSTDVADPTRQVRLDRERLIQLSCGFIDGGCRRSTPVGQPHDSRGLIWVTLNSSHASAIAPLLDPVDRIRLTNHTVDHVADFGG
jgi:hypothetical protein